MTQVVAETNSLPTLRPRCKIRLRPASPGLLLEKTTGALAIRMSFCSFVYRLKQCLAVKGVSITRFPHSNFGLIALSAAPIAPPNWHPKWPTEPAVLALAVSRQATSALPRTCGRKTNMRLIRCWVLQASGNTSGVPLAG